MIDGQWKVPWDAISQQHPKMNYRLAPVLPSPAHPELANTVVVHGLVVSMPAGSINQVAAAQLLAWMTSHEILTQATYPKPYFQSARRQLRMRVFSKKSDLKLFMDLVARPNTRNIITTQ